MKTYVMGVAIAGGAVVGYLTMAALYCGTNSADFAPHCVNVFHPLIALFVASAVAAIAGLVTFITTF